MRIYHKHNSLRNRISHPLLGLLMAIIFLGASCDPNPTPPPTPPVNAGAEGMYILNEGLFQMNNCSLSYYDFQTNAFTPDIFLQVNNRGLGDTGNDLQRYGDKMYCVINNSHRVEIIDFYTAKSIKVINLAGKSPRRVVFNEGKAFVSCYDGDIVRIDTNTMEIDATFHSGNNPEGMCVCNGKLYVANSGGLNFPNYDNTVSVFDLGSLTKINTIEVGSNPFKMSCDGQYVYVCSRGDYSAQSSELAQIDASTDQIRQRWPSIQNFAIYEGKAYVYDVQYKAANSIRVIDLNNPTDSKTFITDGTSIQMPYCITVNPFNGDVYITDAYNFAVTGDVYCFDNAGKKKFSFSAGINPNSIIFK